MTSGEKSWRTLNKKVANGEGTHFLSIDATDSLLTYQALVDVLDPDGDYNTFPFTEHFRQEKWSTKPLFHMWSEVTKPTLVLYGSEDIFCIEQPSNVIQVFAEHESPNAQNSYKVIAGADHSFHEEPHTEIGEVITWWSKTKIA
ncbi:alpha/beta hydrolase [Candidatus Woesebacteria bacterium]|nr:alpha/beta hydrolase [Candidatus Woesebacteria bacterium]